MVYHFLIKPLMLLSFSIALIFQLALVFFLVIIQMLLFAFLIVLSFSFLVAFVLVLGVVIEVITRIDQGFEKFLTHVAVCVVDGLDSCVRVDYCHTVDT